MRGKDAGRGDSASYRRERGRSLAPVRRGQTTPRSFSIRALQSGLLPVAVSQASLVRGTAGRRHRGYVPQALFCESCTDLLYKRVAILFAACAVALVAVGAVAASRGHVAEPAVVPGLPPAAIRPHPPRPLVL